MGVIIGINIAPKHKKVVTEVAASIFMITYVPLMVKFFEIIFRKHKEI